MGQQVQNRRKHVLCTRSNLMAAYGGTWELGPYAIEKSGLHSRMILTLGGLNCEMGQCHCSRLAGKYIMIAIFQGLTYLPT